jgi:hypothetical protein
LEQQKEPEEILRNVVATVEVLTILNDETRLSKKISENLVKQTQQVILEDIAFVMSYPTELVDEDRVPVHAKMMLLQDIGKDLHPVLEQLESLLATHPASHDFSHLFEWRTTLDVQRQRLHDKAMRVIEEKVRALRQTYFSMDDPILPLEGEVAMASPLTIPEIEESLISLLHVVRRKDTHHFSEKERRLFEAIKRQAQAFLDSEERYEHEEALDRLFSSIQKLEELLGMSEE